MADEPDRPVVDVLVETIELARQAAAEAREAAEDAREATREAHAAQKDLRTELRVEEDRLRGWLRGQRSKLEQLFSEQMRALERRARKAERAEAEQHRTEEP